MKIEKGKYGYLNLRHKTVALRTAAMLAFTLFLVLMGRVVMVQYGKVFIICAIISTIPAAMSAVNLIMFLRFKTGKTETYEQIEAVKGNIPVLYDCVVTTDESSYGLNSIAVVNKNIIGFSEYSGVDTQRLERYFSYITKKSGFKNWNIKVFLDLDKYKNRLIYLNEKNVTANSADAEMLDLIKAISL